MARYSNDSTRRRWQQRFAQFGRSGQSVARFCSGEGVSVASFYNWRKKLGMDGARPRPAGQGSAFQPVTILPTAPGVSIHLTCGTRIELRAEDLDAVRAVVAEVVRAEREPQAAGGPC